MRRLPPLVLALVASAAQAQSPTGAQILSATGTVTFNEKPVKTGDIVQGGGILKTGDASAAKIFVRDAKTISILKANAAIELPNAKTPGNFRLVDGVTRWVVGKVKDGKPVTVSTATAVMGIRGTEFVAVANTALGESEIVSLGGTIDFMAKADKKNAAKGDGQDWPVGRRRRPLRREDRQDHRPSEEGARLLPQDHGPGDERPRCRRGSEFSRAQGSQMIAALVLAAAVSAATPAATPATPPAAADMPLDYQLLGHKLSLTLLRAGSHDESGKNEYRFKAAMHALLNSSEERNLPFEKRKKLTADIGEFGDTTLDALSAWKPDEKTHDVKELKVDGDKIRELVARAMKELKAKESDVAVMVELVLVQKGKKYFVLGEDHEIARASYYPIAPTKFDTPFRTNTALELKDEKGLDARVSVIYGPTTTKP